MAEASDGDFQRVEKERQNFEVERCNEEGSSNVQEVIVVTI